MIILFIKFNISKYNINEKLQKIVFKMSNRKLVNS